MSFSISISERQSKFPYGPSKNLEKIHNKFNLPLRASSFFQERQLSLSYIENLYSFKSPREKVMRYLINNSDLIPILIEAYYKIKGFFGEFPIYLELYHDLEEDWKELYIIIKTDYPAEEAIKRETKFFENWFVKVMDKSNGRLNFTEEPL